MAPSLKKVFFPSRDVTSIQLANITLLVLVSVLFAIDQTSGVHMAALVATTMLATTIIPARLLGLRWLTRFEAELVRISYQGKWLGIWTSVWFGFYTAFALVLYYGTQFNPIDLIQRETVLLSESMMIFVILLALSNKWSYKYVKWWKQINMLIWLTIPFLFTHFLLAANVFGDVGYFWAPWTLLVLMSLAGISSVFRSEKGYFAWWRVWLLVVGTVLSALVVWFYPSLFE